MSNVPNRKTIFVQPETHQRLNNLKRQDETFDSVISRILDLEDKYNPLDDIFEYEYIYRNGTAMGRDGQDVPVYQSRLFRVIYRESVKKEYYSMISHEFKDNINAWDYFPKMPNEAIESFVKFIIKESNLYVLYEMEEELLLNNIWIKRV